MLLILTIPYFLGLLFFGLLGIFAIYRLMRFGRRTAGNWAILLFFSLGTIIVITITLFLFSTIEWSASETLIPGNFLPNL